VAAAPGVEVEEAARLPAVLVSPRRGKPATAAEMRVWHVLARVVAGESVRLPIRQLAAAAGVSPETARRALLRFERCRLVHVSTPQHRGRGYATTVTMRWRSATTNCDLNGVPAIMSNNRERTKQRQPSDAQRMATPATQVAGQPTPVMAKRLDLPPSWRGYCWAMGRIAAEVDPENAILVRTFVGARLHAAAFGKRPRLRTVAELEDAAQWLAWKMRVQDWKRLSQARDYELWEWASKLVARACSEIAATRALADGHQATEAAAREQIAAVRAKWGAWDATRGHSPSSHPPEVACHRRSPPVPAGRGARPRHQLTDPPEFASHKQRLLELLVCASSPPHSEGPAAVPRCGYQLGEPDPNEVKRGRK